MICGVGCTSLRNQREESHDETPLHTRRPRRPRRFAWCRRQHRGRGHHLSADLCSGHGDLHRQPKSRSAFPHRGPRPPEPQGFTHLRSALASESLFLFSDTTEHLHVLIALSSTRTPPTPYPGYQLASSYQKVLGCNFHTHRYTTPYYVYTFTRPQY